MVNHFMKEVKDVPWKVKEVMEQRIEFVVRAVSKEKTVSELCQAYGISRTTGHHWVERVPVPETAIEGINWSRKSCS